METQRNEINEMRQQMGILSKKIEKQELVGDRLVREVMRGKMSWVRKYLWVDMIAIVVLIIIIGCITINFHLSFGPTIYISLLLLISAVIEYYINMLRDNVFLSDNLTDTAMKLIEMKKRRAVFVAICIPLVMVWIVWFGYEASHLFTGDAIECGALWGGLACGLAGCVFGGILEVRIYRKMQRTNDELIRQIHEMKED